VTHGHTKESLIAFEERVAAAFERKEIRGPIHLCSDEQAEPLIGLFHTVNESDWVFGTWRNHWLALLKGVPEDELFETIRAGRSMFVCDAARRIVCSAIVGGILPLALGVALGIQRRGTGERVHVFCGDMAARTGLYHEFIQYARGHALPVRVVIEDNGLSTNADTGDTWGRANQPPPVVRYTYRRNRPHTGTGRHVTF
jgi:TPP-dependent pyruvate/acetoin dehydrogenase alpha subunit